MLPDRGESDQEVGEAAAIPLPADPEPEQLPKIFQLDKSRSKELRSWMTALQKPSESKQLRENFSPTFEKSSFELQVPKLDPSMARRLREVKSVEASKAEAKEKSLVAAQFKILDIAKPLLYVWGSAAEAAVADPLLVVAAESALQLWGHAFHNITMQRRENVLRQTDPRFESLLAESTRFKPKECALLFGRSFLRGMVKDASDDQKLKALGRPGGHPSSSSSSRHGKSSSSSRGVKGGRSGSGSGFNLHGSFNKRGSKQGSFSRNSRSVSSKIILAVPQCMLPLVVDVKVGGRVSQFAPFWQHLTADDWVLSSVSEGVRIPFASTPFQSHPGKNMPFSPELTAICQSEIYSLLAKGAVEKIPLEEQCFVSGIFVIPKSSGGFRPIVNLKGLNKFVEQFHFKMEGVSVMKGMVRKGDYFTKLDLQDAYLTIPIHSDDRKFLQFMWDGSLFQFSCLCFGLSSAPWTFTKILKPVVATLRRSGIRIVVYLDDFLILNQSKEGAERDFARVIEILEKCGFLINREKSVGVAAQEREFLGLLINSKELSLSLLPKKVDQIIEICHKARSSAVVSLREVAKILGNLAWAIQAIPFAQGHYRALQRLFIAESARADGDLSSKIRLNEESRAELEWWSSNVRGSNGRPMSVRDPDLVIFSDASLSGWGASLNDASARGPWAGQDRFRHINELELMAALFALKSFTHMASRVSVRLMMDNATAVHYVNNAGGSRSQRLCQISAEIVAWCEQRSISINAEHLPGTQNVVADRLSRAGQDSSDWRLNPSIFSLLRARWSLRVDLFASSWNKQLDQFVSWGRQPDALAVDAFSLDWTGIGGYAFPPFCLIQRCLMKSLRDQAELTLVTPLWPAQTWFPLLLELACEPALILPRVQLLLGPTGQPHPLSESLLLVAWRLSGDSSRAAAFRAEWSSYSWEGRVTPHQLLTSPRGVTGVIGVFERRPIPCLLL